MPAIEVHQSAAIEYLTAFRVVPGDNRCPRVVTLYLSALHLVEIAAAHQGIHNEDHQERYLWLKFKQPELFKLYRPIFDAGYKARYFPDQLDHSAATIDEHLYKKCYRTLGFKVAKIVGPSSTLVHDLALNPPTPATAVSGRPKA